MYTYIGISKDINKLMMVIQRDEYFKFTKIMEYYTLYIERVQRGVGVLVVLGIYSILFCLCFEYTQSTSNTIFFNLPQSKCLIKVSWQHII